MVERNEFESWMGVLREDIKGVHDRLDTLNGRVRSAENSIAVLNDRGSSGRDTTARWAGFGSILAGAATFLYQTFFQK